MKKAITFIILLLSLSVLAQNEIVEGKIILTSDLSMNPTDLRFGTEIQESILEITFQDFFKKDIISLKLNGCKVFDGVILNSNELNGCTDLIVKVLKSDSILLSLKEVNLNCDEVSLHNLVTIEMFLNKNKNVFEVDLRKGKYIGFDKKGSSKLSMLQSKMPFQYD